MVASLSLCDSEGELTANGTFRVSNSFLFLRKRNSCVLEFQTCSTRSSFRNQILTLVPYLKDSVRAHVIHEHEL